MINDRAAIDGPLAVELRNSPAPLPGTWTRIEAVDARALTLRDPGGQARAIPLESVTGALAGAVIGYAIGGRTVFTSE